MKSEIELKTTHTTINEILYLMFCEHANSIPKSHGLKFIDAIDTFDEPDLKSIIEAELEAVIIRINEEQESEFACATVQKISRFCSDIYDYDDFIKFHESILKFDKLVDEVLIERYNPATDFFHFYFDVDPGSIIPIRKKMSLATNTVELLKNGNVKRCIIIP